MHKESSGRANAHNAPHIRRMRTRTPLPREARQTQPRERHAVAPSGLLRERRLWSCAVNCAATPRRSCMRQQLESSRTASRPTHPLLARGSRARDCLTPVETSACCAARREARGSALHDRNVASPTSSYEAAPATRRMVHAERSREQAVWNALRVSVAFQTPRRTPKVAVKRPHCEQKIIAGERFFSARAANRSENRVHAPAPCRAAWSAAGGAPGPFHIIENYALNMILCEVT